MKFRKRNVRCIIIVFVLFSAFLLQGCGNAGLANVDSRNSFVPENPEGNSSTKKEKKKDSLLYFSNDVSIIKVSHSNGSGQHSWNLNKKDIPQFREWALSLQLKQQNFEEGESPGDYNGGDAYDFQISGDTPLRFTYMDIGDNNGYIEIKGKWYLITNHNSIPVI